MTAKFKTWWSEWDASVNFLKSQSQCCMRKEAPTASQGGAGMESHESKGVV